MVSVLRWWLCMLSLYQAERTRAEEQLHQKDNQIQQNEAEILQKDAELGQARTQLQQQTTELDNVQESLQVLTITVKPPISLSPLL